jgi:hypothetical protein
MLGFAQEKRKTRDGRTWWVLAADEGHEDGGLGTWRRAAAAVATAQSSAPETGNTAHARATGERRVLNWRTKGGPEGEASGSGPLLSFKI